MRRKRESGQVLITGVVMMVVLLLVILYAFDVHNVIRAKMKVDIAQQSAAMTTPVIRTCPDSLFLLMVYSFR